MDKKESDLKQEAEQLLKVLYKGQSNNPVAAVSRLREIIRLLGVSPEKLGVDYQELQRISDSQNNISD